jgi:signal transduction histidine kinase
MAFRRIPSPKGWRRDRVLFYAMFGYIVASFLWWGVLFLRANQRAFREDVAHLRSAWVAAAPGRSAEGFTATEAYRERAAELRRRNGMVAGEGLVFLSLIAVGCWRINASFRQEIELSRRQNNFLLAITHELKSPLASLRLGMDTLRKRDLDTERVRRIASLSLEDVDRLERLVENILMASQLEDPRHRFEHAPFDLGQTAAACVAALERRYPGQAFRLRREGALRAEGDAFAWASVLTNLLDNAVKYAPPGSAVDLDLERGREQITVTVSDRGPGIPEEERARIFERFYRVGNEETRSTKGTGLGLFIVQEIVRAHGGRIQVLDREGGGTRFRVHWPVPRAEIEAETPSLTPA